MNLVISNNLNLKSGCKDIGIIIFDFVTKTHFLSSVISYIKISKVTYTNSLIFTISLQPEDVNHWYFELRFFDLTEFMV